MTTSDRQIVISRVFEAPRAKVFAAFTQPEHLVAWWGPRGFTLTHRHHDVRDGGTWEFTMHGFGKDYANFIRYTRVVTPERLEFEHGTSASEILFTTVVTFADEGAGTRVTLTQTHPTAEKCAAIRTFAVDGGNSTMECLAEYLPTMDAPETLVLARTFAAPRERVFAAWTDPAQLAKWWGPKGFTMRVATLEARPGGAFQYAMTSPAGQEMWGRFEYFEVTAPERLVFRNAFSNAAGEAVRHPMAPAWPLWVLNRVTFEARDGGTLLTLRGVPLGATAEERAMFAGAHKNVEAGFKGTLDALDALLAGTS